MPLIERKFIIIFSNDGISFLTDRSTGALSACVLIPPASSSSSWFLEVETAQDFRGLSCSLVT